MNNNNTIKTPSHFKPLYTDEFMYCVYYGGRGGGKSEEVSKALVLLAVMKPLRILCIRETQNSIDDSVKASLERWISNLELENYYKITRDSLSTSSGSQFMFKGMQAYNAGNIKSISMIDITWIEEAEYFSKRSWDLLIPSVIRVQNPKIIVTFNPAFEDDIVYKTFISGTPPPKSFIKKVSYLDNAYFKDTPLELQRAFDEQNLPAHEYNHKWLGELVSVSEESLWNKGILDTMVINDDFNRDLYSTIVIGCDPATTNKDFSNEYGIVVMGITQDGIYHCIDDASGNMNPNQFALEVSRLYKLYNASKVVVEINNGGDFIKATLLSIDSTLNISEVRASVSKVTRFIPVANLAHMGKVKHIKSGFKKLERQMKLTSMQGFKGVDGESPDRLDAYTWALYDLAGLRDKDTEQSVFQPEWFKNDYSKGILIANKVTYVSVVGSYLAYITCKFVEINFKNYVIITNAGFLNKLKPYDYLKVTHSIFMPDNTLNEGFYEELLEKGFNVTLYDVNSEKLSNRVLRVAPYVQGGYVSLLDCKPTSYNNELGQHLKLQLMRYNLETKLDYPLVGLFCDLIENEKEL